MQFLTIATTLFAAALAAPAPQTSNSENIDISDFNLRQNPGIQSASFTLAGTDGTAKCEIGAVETLPSEVQVCGDSAYRFGLIEAEGDATYGVRIYHETSPFAGKTGEGEVPVYCRAGGNGAEDFVCQQADAVTIFIQ